MRLKLNTMKTELIWFDRRLTNSNELTSLILNRPTQASVATGWTGRGVFETDANSVSFLGRGGDLGHSSVWNVKWLQIRWNINCLYYWVSCAYTQRVNAFLIVLFFKCPALVGLSAYCMHSSTVTMHTNIFAYLIHKHMYPYEWRYQWRKYFAVTHRANIIVFKNQIFYVKVNVLV